MNQYIDLYCERLDQGLFAEPINLISNISFIVAGIVHLCKYSNGNISNPFHKKIYLYMIIIILLIGMGSSLFHSFATQWAMIADVIPIGIYLISYLPIYCISTGNDRIKPILLLSLYFIFVTAVGALIPSRMVNGSQNYFGALITLTNLGFLSKLKAHKAYEYLMMASGFLAASLLFRALDQVICPIIPLGTHFLWHICNGIVLYFSLEFIREQISPATA